jgi:hypothetical protein
MPRLTSAGGSDVACQVFDPSGRLRSIGRWGGPDDEFPAGAGVDPTGNLLVVGTTTPAGSTNGAARVFLVKLAR